MNLIRLQSFTPLGWNRTVVTIGNFDGVHRGHQALLKAARENADVSGGKVVVLTFDPHPSSVLNPSQAPCTLMTLPQKAEFLSDLGADSLVVLPFTWELSQKTAEEFVRLFLQKILDCRLVVVGSSFRFGYGRAGDVAQLGYFGHEMDFCVHAVEPLLYEGVPISSTRIRESLAYGAVDVARDLLGRRFFIDGRVVRGAGRGRGLGSPTANLSPENETLPAVGVYACWLRLRESNTTTQAVVNIGQRPTFGGGQMTVEAHLLDFEGDLYDRSLRIEFEGRIREERTFSGPEALKTQIQDDIQQARKLLAS